MKLSTVLNVVMGLALMAAGSWLVYAEVSVPPVHSGHLYVGCGVAMLGALLINPDAILGRVKSVVIVLLPIIPWSRKSVSVPVVPDDPTKDKG